MELLFVLNVLSSPRDACWRETNSDMLRSYSEWSHGQAPAEAGELLAIYKERRLVAQYSSIYGREASVT